MLKIGRGLRGLALGLALLSATPARGLLQSGPRGRQVPRLQLRPGEGPAQPPAPKDKAAGLRWVRSAATLGHGLAWLPVAALADEDFASLARLGETGSLPLKETGLELLAFLLKTVITWGVPTLFVGVALTSAIGGAFASAAAKREAGGDMELPGFLKKLAGGDDEAAPGKEYLEVERLNDKLESFQFSLRKATDGKQTALARRRRQLLGKELADELGPLSDAELDAIASAGKKFRTKREKLRKEVERAQRDLRASALPTGETDAEAAVKAQVAELRGQLEEARAKVLAQAAEAAEAVADTVTPGEAEAEPAAKAESEDATAEEADLDASSAKEKKEAASSVSELGKLLARQTELEREYLSAVGKVLAPQARERFRKVLQRRKANPSALDDASSLLPLPILTKDASTSRADRRHVFVLDFFGDVQASQVSNLRQEVTAVLQAADVNRGDEVVLVLNTGGGTVTGYGLAAAQLLRLKEAGLRLTISVEQVAASGGYMMACCADRLAASPFAVLGSIGVITDIPNVYERLKREGIEFQTVTAGKFKRTLTPTKPVTKEDIVKTKADIEAVLKLFKDFVATQRPVLNIEEVATGETWFGPDAFDRGLCDELKTSDDILLELRDDGAEIYAVRYKEPKGDDLLKLLQTAQAAGAVRQGLAGRGLLGRIEELLTGDAGRNTSPVNAALLEQLGQQALARASKDLQQGPSVFDETASYSPLFMDESDASNRIRAEAPRRSRSWVPEDL